MMKSRMFSIAWNTALAIVAATLFLLPTSNAATTDKVLYSFSSTTGTFPAHGLAKDAAGNLYGTTYSGGASNCGVVFQLVPDNQGHWTQNILKSFTCNLDGGNPQGPITVDANGNLYGTTWLGGVKGHGTLFRLKPLGDGTWDYKVLHSFTWGVDGGAPVGSIIFDANGAIYGAAFSGGAFGYGAVYQATVDDQDVWTINTLHSFNKDQRDGYNPLSGVTFDAAGNIYGVTQQGGTKAFGVLYQLSKDAQGNWNEKVIHSFDPSNGIDGGYPVASLLLGADGALYGTTSSGGKAGFYGTAFKFALVNNRWKQSILHSFTNGADGGQPLAGLIADANGNLYGTCSTGGTGFGMVYRLSLNQQGKWAEKVIYNFKGGSDGSKPESNLMFDATGNLLGTTQQGGANNMGTAFLVKP